MQAVPRRYFLPADKRHLADDDVPVRLTSEATNSQPTTVRRMLELLDVRAASRVLDVGAGSGWTTALLAHLTGPAGSVVAVELDPALAEWSAGNVAALDFPWASIRPAEPGVLGWPPAAPYDRILVSANADRLPQSLVEQLTADALMVIPVAGEMCRVHRAGREQLEITRHGAYAFVPLR
jgi:protein-L-isoaspartate(D-aspartate) O-methyltransferase